MRIDVTPTQISVRPGNPVRVSIAITNTSSIISGFQIRVLGADPSWVQLETDFVSMFPEESRTLTAIINVPAGIAAGVRRTAIQVREVTPPYETNVAELDLTVPPDRRVTARLDPVAVVGGKNAKFTMLVENTGNTVVRAEVAVEDPESHLTFVFEPGRVALAPGEHALVDMTASGKRKLTGSPRPRPFAMYLDDVPDDAFFIGDDVDPETPAASREDAIAVTNGTFIQKSVLSRGVLSLGGLLVAISVFALVITFAMSKLVGQSASDRNLALQVAQALRDDGSNTGTSTISGTVRLLTSGAPVPGVTVAIYDASNTVQPVTTTATGAAGTYHVSELAAGQYKISFRGAKFLQMWYPNALAPADATTVRLGEGDTKSGLDVTVGGLPATISGTVNGDDIGGATLYLEKTVRNGSAGGDSVVVPPTADGSAPGIPPNTGNAIVKSIPIGSDGGFTLAGVPSPSVYILVLAKPGYATSSQTLNVGAGEDRASVQLVLRKGDGSIAGTVTSQSGPLSGVSLTATTGTTSASSVSLTEGPPGGFTLRNLPTPASYTVIATKDGYATETVTLTLAAGQKLTGVALALTPSSATLSGLVKIDNPAPLADGPGAGVTVSVTDGLLTVQTETQSTAPAGTWKVGGLPVPGTYTVTFSRADLAAETVSVVLDAGGHITPTSIGATVTSAGVEALLKPATATVFGTISQVGGARVCDGANGLGEASVILDSGATTYRVTTASTPSARCGDYRIANVPPGSYTLTVEAGSGTIPHSEVIALAAGNLINKSISLGQPASITGSVVLTSGSACGWTVFLYKASDYPATVTSHAKTSTLAGHSGCSNFVFSRVDAGTYILGVSETSDPVNTRTTVSVTIRPGEQFGTPADHTSLVIRVNTSG